MIIEVSGVLVGPTTGPATAELPGRHRGAAARGRPRRVTSGTILGP
jgi:hypothetical protein